jgi:arginine:ornithine antiporter/lysine permease
VNGSPANALLATTVLIQLFLILSFFSKNAYQFFYFIASVAILPPYVLSGAYALKLALSGEGYGADDRSRNWDILVGALATVYGLWLVYAAGLNFLLMCTILFAPGILVYAQARRERGEAVFEGFEAVLAILIVLLAVVAAYLMWTGKISPL